MISIAEAFTILDHHMALAKTVDLPLLKARNLVLAETINAPISMPPFRQAIMDGFAISLHDSMIYEIVGEVKAGDQNQIQLQPGQACKIFTGAAVPDSAQAVIQIEKVSVENKQLLLQENVLPETNVRPLGAQISKGNMALQKGTFLNPAAIGFLAGLGFTSVKVYQKPTVGIVVTGNELIPAGQPLLHGKVYESNAIMLQAALYNAHYDIVNLYQVEDDFENTKTTLQKAIAENTVVLVSGGISVGDYDFVGKALENLGVETLFYKVNQKPGKPLFVGKSNDKIIFALPGNPAASLTCFYIYVKPVLQKLSGIGVPFQTTIQKKLAHDFKINNVRPQFLKSTATDDEVTILEHQDSAMLDSYALANVLVFVPSGNYELHQGDKVDVYTI